MIGTANCLLNKTYTYTLLVVLISTCLSWNGINTAHATFSTIQLSYGQLAEERLSTEHKNTIQSIAHKVTTHVAELMPELSLPMQLTISLVERDLSMVNGVSGQAISKNEIALEIDQSFVKDFDKTLIIGLKSTLYHEYHHAARGWTITDNQFGPGIAIASVNEGLAMVFAEQHSGHKEHWSTYPEEVNTWVEEILNLPINAPYGDWMMGELEDGRSYVGYITGKYIVDQAIQHSELSILELSKLGPFQVLEVAQLLFKHAPSYEKLGDYHAKQGNKLLAQNNYQQAKKYYLPDNQSAITKIDKKLKWLTNPVDVQLSHLAKLTGQYQTQHMAVSVFIKGSTLQVQIPNRPAFTLHAENSTSFFILEADVSFKFINSDTLLMNMMGRELIFERKMDN